MTPERSWPVAVAGDWRGRQVRLRPLRARLDRREFMALRARNAAWTAPWDSSSPKPMRATMTFAQMVHEQDAEARAGRLLPFAVDVDGELVGQMHLFNIVRGAALGGSVGYWIAESFAGQGITPFALAMLIDHSFGDLGLHRVEVNIRPENHSSLRVVEKLAMRDEGLRLRYLHINGAWCDHRSFALTVEDLEGESALDRMRRHTR